MFIYTEGNTLRNIGRQCSLRKERREFPAVAIFSLTFAKRVKEKFQLVGLSVTDRGLQEYVERSGLAFPVYTMMPSNEGDLITGTPRTLVVSREGKVVATWFGAYGGDLRKKVEEYFQLSLPGLSEDEPAGGKPGKLACE